MKPHGVAVVVTALLATLVTLEGSAQTSTPDWFRFKPKKLAVDRTMAVQVEGVRVGRTVKLLLTSTDRTVLGRREQGGMMPMPALETLGSKDIDIKVNANPGYTSFAGLVFYDSARIAIWDDGTVEADRAGIRARTEGGSLRLEDGFQAMQDTTLDIGTSTGIQIKTAGGKLQFEYSGKSKPGSEWVSSETEVDGRKAFLFYLKPDEAGAAQQ